MARQIFKETRITSSYEMRPAAGQTRRTWEKYGGQNPCSVSPLTAFRRKKRVCGADKEKRKPQILKLLITRSPGDRALPGNAGLLDRAGTTRNHYFRINDIFNGGKRLNLHLKRHIMVLSPLDCGVSDPVHERKATSEHMLVSNGRMIVAFNETVMPKYQTTNLYG